MITWAEMAPAGFNHFHNPPLLRSYCLGATPQRAISLIALLATLVLLQMARSDRLGWHAELAEVDNERAEDRGGAVQESPLRPGRRHPVRALVSSIQAES